MKILHIPYGFFPDPVGGTEIYVKSLATTLNQLQTINIIAIPDNKDEEYQYEELRVIKFKIAKTLNLYQLYGEGDDVAMQSFAKVLKQIQPDIVHFHAITGSISWKLVYICKQASIKTVLTYHTPTISCQRGTLMRFGTQICSGKLNVKSCSKCTLQGLGINKKLTGILYLLSTCFGKLVRQLNLRNGLWTVLQMKFLMQIKQQSFYSLMKYVDKIMVFTHWTYEVLLQNQIAAKKISLIRHGICFSESQEILPKKNTATLRLVFIGRYHPTKGAILLIKALRKLKQYSVTIDFYGIKQDNNFYLDTLKSAAQNDPRIRFFSAVPNAQIIPLLRQYDLLVVPSVGLETGPLVVLEAFAAHTPVLGSNFGGIAELIQHEKNGLLIENSITAWAKAIKRCYLNPELVQQLRLGITAPPHINDIAKTIYNLYQEVLVEN